MLWLGLLGLVIIFFFSLLFGAMRIEQEIRSGVDSVLHNAGYKRIVTDVRGRDVMLRGKVASDAAINRSLALSRGVEGVRSVQSALDVAPLRLPHLIIQGDDSNGLIVSGELPNALHVDMLLKQLAQAGYKDADFRVEISTEISEPHWINAVAGMLKLSLDLQSLQIEIGANKVSIAGITDDSATYQILSSNFSAAAEEVNLQIVNRIATVRR